MTAAEMIEKVAEAQSALYALVDTLPKAEDRLVVMAIHSNLGEVVYDLMTAEAAGIKAEG